MVITQLAQPGVGLQVGDIDRFIGQRQGAVMYPVAGHPCRGVNLSGV
jgi:hypothetical protein